MQAVRQFHQVQGRKLVITLPDDFTAEAVEVIVLPTAPSTSTSESKLIDSDSLHDLLLKGPTLSEEELGELQNIHTWMNGWNAKGF